MEEKMNLIFRSITCDDKDEIVALFMETYKKEPWKENWNKKILNKKINDLINNNISENYCAINKENNKIIGAMFGRRNYFIDKKELYIDEFFIDYNFQRKGIGKYLSENIENEIKNKNYSSIILLTKARFPSETFYLKNGFKKNNNIRLFCKII
jgi:ribosomal protein S18 acetylase RimI-like enzyme